jgi:ech hydrogenase subunit B
MEVMDIFWVAALLALAPTAVGLVMGIDRKITARMQNRVGPPILQPFYDLFKLFGKAPMVMNSGQTTFALAYLVLQMAALALFISGGDLLIVFFVSGAGSVALVLGGFSARSPYSFHGSQRELLQILAYEPIFFLVILAIGLRLDTFLVRDIDENLGMYLPLAYVSMIAVLVIKLQKSPYDIATAHSEIVSGPYVEYSGPYLGITKLAHWFEIAIIFGILMLFFWDQNEVVSVLGKIGLVAIAVFSTEIIDNVTARLTRDRMIRFTLAFGIGLVALNLLALYLADEGVIGWP